jgi:flagellar basal-body rod protein FlgC
MTDALSVAVSGLAAASTRISGVASNLANADDTSALAPKPDQPPAYQPVDTVQTTTPTGGTVATYRPVTPASVPAYEPDSPLANDQGLVNKPNVDTAGQLVDLITAKAAYEANLKTVQVSENLDRSLLKILA